MIKGIHILVFAVALLSFDASAWWESRADFGSHGRHRGTGLAIGTKGYMGLGHYNGAGPNIVLADWWEYDPASNSWSQKADYIANSGNGNYGTVAMAIGKFGYLTGGTLGDAMLYKYDPAMNLWTAVVTCPEVFGNRSAFAIGDKGYYVSGSTVYEFDSVSETWSTKNAAPFSTWIWNSAFVLNGKGYMKNGTTLYEYKQSTDAWTPRAAYPGLARSGSVALTHDGKGYIVTGYGAFGLSDVSSEVWEYDPSLNAWNFAGDFPGTSRRFASGFNIGERAFIGIGTNGTNFSDFHEFNPYASLDEKFDITEFTTYPNPSNNHINFKSNNLNSYSIDVFDMLGRKIFTEETLNGEIRFDKGINERGTYIYHVKVDGALVHSNKFIFN